MKKKIDVDPEIITPDLKHDTMEFAAAADGDDSVDIPEETEEITPEELDALYTDDEKEEAEALNTAENDSIADEDNFITEPDNVDELDNLQNDQADN